MRRLAVIAAGTTAAATLLLVFSDGAVEVLGVWGLLAMVLLLALRPDRPGPKPPEPPPPERRRRSEVLPPRLAELERTVSFSQTLRSDFDRRLVPRLRAVAGTRLRAEYGISLEADPGESASLLGPEAWSVLRPDRRASDGVDEGVTLEQIDAVVGALERLGDRS